MAMKTPDPTMTGPNYASAEYAEQLRRGYEKKKNQVEIIGDRHVWDSPNYKVNPPSSIPCPPGVSKADGFGQLPPSVNRRDRAPPTHTKSVCV